MPFQKDKPRPEKAGRTKGVRNHKTKEAVERVEWVLGLLETSLEKDIKKLSPNNRAMLWNSLQEYVRPKLSRTDLNVKGDITEIKVIRGS